MEDCLLFPGLSSFVGGQTFPRMNQHLLNKGATMPPFFSLLAERKCRLEGPTHTKGLTFKVKHISHRGGLALEPHHWSFLSARCRCAPSLASAVTGYSAVLASSAPFHVSYRDCPSKQQNSYPYQNRPENMPPYKMQPASVKRYRCRAQVHLSQQVLNLTDDIQQAANPIRA